MTAPLLVYKREEPDAEDKKKAATTAFRFVSSKSRTELTGTLLTLMLENMRLVSEVNDHRRIRGFEPLPTHDPEIRK